MKSKILASCLSLGLVILSQPVGLAAADVPTAGSTPSASIAQSINDDVKSLPRYILMKDSLVQLSDPREHNYEFRISPPGTLDCDEGLADSGRIRDFILGYPSSAGLDDSPSSAFSLSRVVRHIDAYGLYQLAPLAAKKAINLAGMPLKSLDYDGILGLSEVAQYYVKTGRRSDAAKIFSSLTTKLWPAYEPKALTGSVLYCQADYLQALSDKSKSDMVRQRAMGFSNSPDGASLNIYRPGPEDVIEAPPPAALNARAAYDAISAGQIEKAQALIVEIIAQEKIKKAHSPDAIARLINLAKVLAKRKENDLARNILEQLLPLTESDILANTRFYLCAELYCLPENNPADKLKYWCLVDGEARHIDDLVRLISLAPAGNEVERGDRLLSYFDILSLNLAYSDEGEAAYKLFEKAWSCYKPIHFHQTEFAYHRAYLAAVAAKYAEIMPAMSAEIASASDISFQGDTIGKILSICSSRGQSNVAMSIARQIIDVRTKKRAAEGVLASENNPTPEVHAQNKVYFLANDLAVEYFYLARILNDRGAYAEAERYLKLEPAPCGNFLSNHPYAISLELGRALDGQKKYTEELDVYAKAAENTQYLQSRILWSLDRLVQNYPQMSPEMQSRVIDVARKAFIFKMGLLISGPLERLSVSAKTNRWSESNLTSLQLMVNDSRTAEGVQNVETQ
jgi:tetratricopeptide (TPR) repeat protein